MHANSNLSETIATPLINPHERPYRGAVQLIVAQSRRIAKLLLWGIVWPAAIVSVIALTWYLLHAQSFTFVLSYLRGERLLVYPSQLVAGSGPVGEKRQLRFTIWNGTGQSVEIIGNRSTCGCLISMEDPPFSIPSGQSREFILVLTFGPKQGEFTQTMTWFTNVEDRAAIRLMISGRALADQAPEASAEVR